MIALLSLPQRIEKITAVAIIEPVGGHGGMDYYDYGLAQGLVNAECEVSLYTSDETKHPSDNKYGYFPFFKKIYCSTYSIIKGLRYIIGIVRSISHATLNHKRILHYHFFHIGTIEVVNLTFSKMCLRRTVVTVHDVESFGKQFGAEFVYPIINYLIDAIIVHNKESYNSLLATWCISKDKVHIIPHGNYLHAIQALPAQGNARKALNISRDAKVILFFGQIKDVKGLALLLEAMPDVLKVYPDALLLIAGRPWKSDYSIYLNLMKKLGIKQSCISHIRYIPDEDVPLYYSASDMVTLPYRRIYQSGVVLMAMSYGKAVLVSDLPGMTEIVTDNETGFIFRDGDIEHLAEKICFILANDDIRNQVANNGHDYVKACHDWNLIGKKTIELYKQVLA